MRVAARLCALAIAGICLTGSPRSASTHPAQGRVIVLLSEAGVRARKSGSLTLPHPAHGRDLEPRLTPLFIGASGEAARMFLLSYRADWAQRRPDLPGTNRAWLDALRGSPLVAGAWSDEVFSVSALPNDPVFSGLGGGSPQFHLWNPGGLSLEAARAWPFVPADRTVKVAIIDSGVNWQHPELGGVMGGNAAEIAGDPLEDDDQNGYVDDLLGWDFVDLTGVVFGPGQSPALNEDALVPDANPSDQAGHGTQVAGLVNALTNNGFGIAGAAPAARLLPVRVGWRGTDGGAYVLMSFCAQGLRYAAENGARVANCSWDSADQSGLGLAIAFAVDTMDVVVVGSAGNDGTNSTGVQFLAAHPRTVGVAGIQANGHKAVPSNYGSWVDLAAFYQGMPTTDFDYGTQSSVIRVNPFGGTSFSAPQVAALAALLRAVADTASAATVRAVMKNTARDLSDLDPQFGDELGGGLADYARAVEFLGGGWDAPRAAHGMLPVGGDLVFFSDTTLQRVDIESGNDRVQWEEGVPVTLPQSLPLTVTVSGLGDLLVWKDGDVLEARTAAGDVPPGWPVLLSPDTRTPIVMAGPSDASRTILVPGETATWVLDVTASLVTSHAEPWPFLAVAAAEQGGGQEWVAGVRADGRLQVIVLSGGSVLADTIVSVGPDLLPPVIGELEQPGTARVVAAAGDSASPGDTQRIVFLDPFAGWVHDLHVSGPPIGYLSLAGFNNPGHLEVVVADVSGGIRVIGPDGEERSVDAGGLLAGEVLSVDVDADFTSDLLALRADGTLLAWDAELHPLPGFPRRFPYGASESPGVADGSLHRFAALADTAGRLWSIPMGPPLGPAPWPAASAGGGRSRFLGWAEGTPTRPSLQSLLWNWKGEDSGSLCWSGTSLGDFAGLRVRESRKDRPLVEISAVDQGCLEISGRREGERLFLEGQEREGSWRRLGELVILAPARIRVGMPRPNPFHALVRVAVSGARGPVRARIVDIRGRIVWEHTLRGEELLWPGTDRTGRRVPPGVYILHVSDGKTAVTRRVMKL